MLIIPPNTLREYKQKVKAFHTLFGLEPQVLISGLFMESVTGDIVFLRNSPTRVYGATKVKGVLHFLIYADGASVWVRKHLDDFEMDFI